MGFPWGSYVGAPPEFRVSHPRCRVLAGRISAVNREFVYIDFDDERFPPCEGGEEVTEGASGRGKERRRKEGHNHLRFEPQNIDFL